MMKEPLKEEDLSFAQEEENKSKNRDSTIIPRKFLTLVYNQGEKSLKIRLL